MDEKKYSIVGRVEIGTDEYRDLIEGKIDAEKSRDSYIREGWKKDEEIQKLKKQVEVLAESAERYKNFIKSHCTVNAEDSISLFVNLGE